ncbi:MAG: hypothetical protein ACRDFC_05850 [Ignavibacteria bacterium]
MLKKTSSKIILILLLLPFYNLHSQGRFKGWDVHTSLKEVKSIDFIGSKVWAASTGGMFSFDVNVSPPNIVKYTNLDGLRSNVLSTIFIDNNGVVWAGAIEGSISVYNPGLNNWRYITDIQTSSEASKEINHLFQYSNFMFIATEFSVIRFNINLFQFVDQPYIYLGPLIPTKPPVYETYVVNDTIWAATKFGIAFADIRNNLPIQASWSNYTVTNSQLRNNQINAITFFNNRVYFGTDSGMVFYQNNTLNLYTPNYNGTPITYPVIDITTSNNSLYFATYKGDNKIYRANISNINEAEVVLSGVQVNSLEVNNAGDLLIATPDGGVLKNNYNNQIIPNGPNSNLFFEMSIDLNQNVWVSSGSQGIYTYNGSFWKNYTSSTHPTMLNNNSKHIYASKNSSVVWSGGFGPGLLKIMGDSVYLFHDGNSCLRPFENPGFVLVEGIGEDNNGNLWLINRATSHPIVKFDENPNLCMSYQTPENASENTLINLAIDNFNTKWMTLPTNLATKGIVYFNESVPTGKIIAATQLGQDMTVVNDVTVDNNGEVWIATDNGISIIFDPYEVIQNPNSVPRLQKMRIIANGISTPLTEHILTIRADALNNKWLGTLSNGVIYVSPDGSTILNQFNTSNSPLLDNSVSSIATDKKSGKVYFGSQRGMASYQTIAIEALEECDKITAGPNPYLIPNDNLLRIDGLVEGSSIKILTLSGTLIREFETPGGRIANWDGRDLNGNLVATGIYIIAGFNKDASKVCTGKVAVIRK